jgi:hypothetical protein
MEREMKIMSFQLPFPLTAKLTIKMDRPQLSPADIWTLQAATKAKAVFN